MKNKILFSLLGLFSLVLTSCGDDTDVVINNTIVEMHKVSLKTQELVTETSSPFQAKNAPLDYTHVFPASYKAYFVSKENKGMYTIGQVVKVVDVVSGGNDVVVPKLNYDIIVTNYLKPNGNETQPNAWYMWSDAIAQMPASAQQLYLYGKTMIDYSTATTGTIELVNPYAAIQIQKNQWVTGVPFYYTNANSPYFLGNADWYVLYLRQESATSVNVMTNTAVPLTMPAYNNGNQGNYHLNKQVQANKLYKYTFKGEVGDTGGADNFVVEVDDFSAVHDEDINPLIP